MMRAALLMLVVAVGCGGPNHHITIPPLPSTVTPQQRIDMWNQWSSRGNGTETETSCRQFGVLCTTTHDSIVELQGGVELRHIEDALPIIDPNGKAGVAARRIVEKRSTRSTVKWVFGLASVASTGVMGYGVHENNTTIVFSGLAAVVVSAIIGATAVYEIDSDINRLNNKGLKHYDEGLAQRLNLCVEGLAVKPCDIDSPTAPSAPATHDPILDSLPQR